MEARGRTPALELRLEVADREVAVGDRVYFRMTIRNIGKGPVPIYHDAFKNPEALGENREFKSNAYVMVLGPDGGETRFLTWRLLPMFCHAPPINVPPRKVRKLTPDEELDAFLDKLEKDALASIRRLAPGRSVTTPEWAGPRWVGCAEAPPKTRPGFTELWNIPLDDPGAYRIKAVYDTRSTKEGRDYFEALQNSDRRTPKKGKRAASAFEHFVETPWLTVVAK